VPAAHFSERSIFAIGLYAKAGIEIFLAALVSNCFSSIANRGTKLRLPKNPVPPLNSKREEPMNEEVEFWESRYLAGKTPWDFKGVPEALSRWLASRPPTGRVLVPGCGSGYELKAFDEAGWDVLGIDYTPAAVERARMNAGTARGKVVLGDFFTHDFGNRRFDLTYERTFLCALPPTRWPAYVQRITELLVSGGQLAGFFFFGEQSDPPPYSLTREQQDALFGDRFFRESDEEVTDSIPLFAGRERWQVWRSK